MIAETVYLDEVRRGETKKRYGMTVSLDTGGQDEDGEPAPMSLPDDSEASKPLKLLLDKERNQRLEEAIRRLPTQMRSCFIFRYNHSMSYQQIAVEMRLSIDAVKSHLKEARKRLIADEDKKDS
jgi:RNA polymerase sigma factor (sigma-70 family)